MTICTKNTFLTSQSGAVTVDWVVLTGALVGLGLATMSVVSGGVEDLSSDVDGQLKRNLIHTAFAPGDIGAGLFAPLDADDPNIQLAAWGTNITGGSYGGWTFGTMVSTIDDGWGGLDLNGADFGYDLYTGGASDNALSRTVDTLPTGETRTLTVSMAGYGAGTQAEVVWGGEVVGTVDPEAWVAGEYTFEITGGTGDGSNLLSIRDSGAHNASAGGILTGVSLD